MPAEVVDGARTRALRRAVLRPELTADDPLPGDDIAGVVHFAVLGPDGTAISTCLLFPEPCPWRPGPGWHLRQMATDPAYRGRGLGADVLAGVVDHIAARGGGVLWCSARDTAASFYQRAGFCSHGDPFVEQSLPHRHMGRVVEGAN